MSRAGPLKHPSANHNDHHRSSSSLKWGSRTTKSPSGQSATTLLLLALLQLHNATRAAATLDASPAGRPPGARASSWTQEAAPPTPFPASRLGRLHSQLAHLRRQLEVELRGEPQVALLGAPCLEAGHCAHLAGARCNLDSFTCTCASQHLQFNSTTCLGPTLLGFECLVDGQCQQKVPGSVCSRGQCSCREEYVPHRKDKCLPASKLDDYCLADAQCQLNDPHSHCRWRIPRVYGHCKCPPNYKIMAVNATAGPKCVPRLGDTCLNDSECLLATADSLCGAAPDRQRPSWPSSRASSLSCQCRPGFRPSPSRLECRRAPGEEEEEAGEGRQVALGSRDRYELVLVGANATSDRAGPAPPHQSDHVQSAPVSPDHAPSARPANTTSPVSLGQRCSASSQCRAADPHSQCLGGRCECLAPGPACSANATGCHADTFQCRRSGQCISWYFVCDQFKNCEDGSDEEACGDQAEGGAACPPEAFRCESGSRCLSRAKLCNGRRECPDGSDERHCSGLGQAACPPRTFACRSGLCLPAHVLCNAVDDCPDGSDEEERLCDARAWQARRRTPEAARPAPAPDSPVVRWERRRIQQQMAALRAPRGLPRAQLQAECPAGAFVCANGRCRSSAVLCSGVDGCGDNSDENRCQVCRCAGPPAAAKTAAATD